MNLQNYAPATLDSLPAALRALVDAELAAGNAIEEISSGFPAPPVGACVKLLKPITTRAADANDGLSSCAWPNWDRRTGFTDAKGHFFVLNPAAPPPLPPDMDAIREAANRPPVDRELEGMKLGAGDALRRFQQSMVIDYERWHDGVGYDLEAIRTAPPADRAAIERILLRRGLKDWRDVEALALFDTAQAKIELRAALESAGPEIAMAVLQYAAHVATGAQREAALLRALKTATIYGGLTATIEEVVKFHSPAVIDAVLRGCLERPGEVAGHLAGLTLRLHGKAKTSFDWNQRPLLLRFNTPDRAAREAAYRDLCAVIGK